MDAGNALPGSERTYADWVVPTRRTVELEVTIELLGRLVREFTSWRHGGPVRGVPVGSVPPPRRRWLSGWPSTSASHTLARDLHGVALGRCGVVNQDAPRRRGVHVDPASKEFAVRLEASVPSDAKIVMVQGVTGDPEPRLDAAPAPNPARNLGVPPVRSWLRSRSE